MLLEGSCHCKAITFTVETNTPYPYMRCYCSICRKTGGGGGYAINIMGQAETLQVTGRSQTTVYQAKIDGVTSSARRHFCKRCGSALWVEDPRWPDLMHPFASAIDTPLPKPPQRVHIMLDHAAGWARLPSGRNDVRFDTYPDESIETWHKGWGLLVD